MQKILRELLVAGVLFGIFLTLGYLEGYNGMLISSTVLCFGSFIYFMFLDSTAFPVEPGEFFGTIVMFYSFLSVILLSFQIIPFPSEIPITITIFMASLLSLFLHEDLEISFLSLFIDFSAVGMLLFFIIIFPPATFFIFTFFLISLIVFDMIIQPRILQYA